MKTPWLIIIFSGLLAAFSACSIGRTNHDQNPPATAVLVRSWKMEDFAKLIQEQQAEVEKISAAPKPNNAPLSVSSLDIPFGVHDLPKFLSHAKGGDLVLWYSEQSGDRKIDYICLQRDGMIIRALKRGLKDNPL